MKRTSLFRKYMIMGMLAAYCAAGCGRKQETPAENLPETTEEETVHTGLANETAADGQIDFDILQKENPDIFAWLYVPGTGIDYPVLQSPVSDDYYDNHTAESIEGAEGALYTEMPNLMDMCDFNTVIHGKDGNETDLFADIHQYENPDFFRENDKIYLYLPGNILTYTIFAAYYDDGSDILRRYDYTSIEGCQEYLDALYQTKAMNRNIREGWEGVTPGHFLITLNGLTDSQTNAQYVVIGALVADAAGTVGR